jgi:hypothetical protein
VPDLSKRSLHRLRSQVICPANSRAVYDPLGHRKPLFDRYDKLMQESGLFLDPAAETLRKAPIQQFMREHVLAQASIMRGDYAEGRLLVVAPSLNWPVQAACRRYANTLAPDEGKVAKFGTVTLEAFIAAIREHGDASYADALFRRYCDWSLIDDAIEANVPAKLAR